MKNLLSVSALILAASLANAQSINSGGPKGSYHNDLCPQIKDALAKEHLNFKCNPSQGTGENVERANANLQDVNIGQLNIMATLPMDEVSNLTIVEPNLGNECLFAATRSDGMDTLSDISKRAPVALPGETSGSTLTYQQIAEGDEALTAVRNITHYETATLAVQSVLDQTNETVFFVAFPNPDGQPFKIANKAKLKWVPVINRDILRMEVNGVKLFEAKEVKVKNGKFGIGKGGTVVTACTRVVVFTGSEDNFTGNDADDQKDVLSILATVERPQDKKWAKIFDSVKTLSADTLAKYTN